MKLKIFEHGQGWGGSNLRTLAVNKDSGAINLSRTLVKEMGLKAGQYLTVAQDEDNPSAFYITVSNDERGFRINNKKAGNNKVNSLYSTNLKCVSSIVNACKAKKSVTLLVASKPIEVDGEQWYKLITSKPVKIL